MAEKRKIIVRLTNPSKLECDAISVRLELFENNIKAYVYSNEVFTYRAFYYELRKEKDKQAHNMIGFKMINYNDFINYLVDDNNCELIDISLIEGIKSYLTVRELGREARDLAKKTENFLEDIEVK